MITSNENKDASMLRTSMQDELFKNYLTRVSDPLEGPNKGKRERRNSDTAI